MNIFSKKRTILISFTIILILFFYFLFLNLNTKEIAVLSSKTTAVSLQLPKNCEIENNNDDLKVSLNTKQDKNTVNVYSKKTGKYNLKTKLFGIIPINNYNINVLPDTKLYPSGSLVGVNVNTKGAIAVQFQDITDINDNEVCPAKEAGIKTGDIIIKIGNTKVYNAKEVTKKLNSLDKSEVSILVKRDNTNKLFSVKPVKAKDDNKYKIGLWVRDSIAGIGTLTCYTSDFKRFVALGHSINDVDTGVIMPVKTGELMESELISVVKGKKNSPGELRGILKPAQENVIGQIEENNDFGIYGYVTKNISLKNPLNIALQDEIKEGDAQILTTVEGSEPKLYDIKIKKTYKQTKKNTKSMQIEITDKDLIAKTGGIVQGMSGSPIIQNGKIVGAVTHVFINNPKKGYGIYIEWLLEDLISEQN